MSNAQPTAPPTPTTVLEIHVMDLLEQALNMKLGLSDDDSHYDLHFISQKLAQVSVFQERLSDIQMALTKVSLETIKWHRALTARLNLKVKESRATDEYSNMPLNEKGFWLDSQHPDLKEDSAAWSALAAVVAEVKNAVAERVSAMKRLDSDLRLHSRIYEQKVAAGATSPSSYKGNSTNEIDL